MNGVKNETHVKVEQTSRGIWYCTSVDVYSDNTTTLMVDLDLTMKMVEGVLATHNKYSDEPTVEAKKTDKKELK